MTEKKKPNNNSIDNYISIKLMMIILAPLNNAFIVF